jgi:hypothetical protein
VQTYSLTVITKYKARKRQYIQLEKTLIVGKVLNLIAKQIGSYYKKSEIATKRVCIGRRCGTYSKTRYNSYTYKVEIEDIDNSNTSKE